MDDKGELFLLAAGKVRARFRRSMSRPELLEPDKVYDYRLDLWQTGLSPAGVVRLGVLHYNTAAEVDRLLGELATLAG